MNENSTIHIKAWDSEKGCVEETGEIQNVYDLGRSMSLGNLAALIEEFLNWGGKGYREGHEIGLMYRCTHRTLQRLVICFALGLIAGLSEQQFTDPRNETAIQTAKKIAQMLADGELPVGLYI